MSTVTVTFQNHIKRICLNRPDVHNAFNVEMIDGLTKSFADVLREPETRVVVLEAQGKSFCSGADLGWMKSMAGFSFEENVKDSRQLFTLFETAANCPVPVIGRVKGNVFGGGLGLVSVCDIVAAEAESKFCFSEVKLGLVPAVISPFVLRKCNPPLAKRMMLTAQIFDAPRALEMGLVQFVGTEEEVEDFAQSQAEFITGNGPGAVRATKRLLNYISTHEWEDIHNETVRVIAERRTSAEGQEGMTAFFEKRKPKWKK